MKEETFAEQLARLITEQKDSPTGLLAALQKWVNATETLAVQRDNLLMLQCHASNFNNISDDTSKVIEWSDVKQEFVCHMLKEYLNNISSTQLS
jgi:hypothetical protein